jgi:hypothetical protein
MVPGNIQLNVRVVDENSGCGLWRRVPFAILWVVEVVDDAKNPTGKINFLPSANNQH